VQLWTADTLLVLASKSETRHAILCAAEVPHEVEPAELDEREIERRGAAANAAEVAALLAREKALAVAGRRAGALVLGADQTLAVGNRRFAKPADRAAAREQLLALRNRTHELHSAIALARDSAILFEHRDTARLTMRAFSEEFIDRYLEVAGDAATASVGAYQLEKAGIQLFETIEGDHFVILGLPLFPLLRFLRGQGYLLS
jgi:nucleoside triphosphate pyrophosphatase